MYYDNKWNKKNPLLNPLSDDWFIWDPHIQNSGNWNVCIKCYTNMAEIIATNLRNNIGSSDNIYNILGFLFCIRQAIELSLKQLWEIKQLNIKDLNNLHDLKKLYNKINNLYDWNNYGIIKEKFVDALEFMQDKNEIFRYPYDKKKNNYETVAIHLSDWLFLVHALYYIITEEQERNEANA